MKFSVRGPKPNHPPLLRDNFFVGRVFPKICYVIKNQFFSQPTLTPALLENSINFFERKKNLKPSLSESWTNVDSEVRVTRLTPASNIPSPA